jgi:Na+-transporting NADH:ubiquinone oxidoreductase subunit NqrB
MKNLSLRFWFLLIVSGFSGVLIALMDTSRAWDDMGITVGAIMMTAFISGLLLPKFAWLWALIIGGCVFGFNVVLKDNYGSAMALVFAFSGSYIGVFITNQFK